MDQIYNFKRNHKNTRRKSIYTNPNKKCAKYMNRYFTNKYVKIILKHKKRYLISATIRET